MCLAAPVCVLCEGMTSSWCHSRCVREPWLRPTTTWSMTQLSWSRITCNVWPTSCAICTTTGRSVWHTRLSPCYLLLFSSVQFNLFNSSQGKVSERPAWKDESLALLETDCDWWRRAKVKRKWVPDNWSCDEEAPPSKPGCSSSWQWC